MNQINFYYRTSMTNHLMSKVKLSFSFRTYNYINAKLWKKFSHQTLNGRIVDLDLDGLI